MQQGTKYFGKYMELKQNLVLFRKVKLGGRLFKILHINTQ